jgi:hypothetical protein
MGCGDMKSMADACGGMCGAAEGEEKAKDDEAQEDKDDDVAAVRTL